MSEHKVELAKDILMRLRPGSGPDRARVNEAAAVLIGGFLGDVASIARSLEEIARRKRQEAHRQGGPGSTGRRS